MTVPRHRENPNIIEFTMLCPGISQNTKHHQLTLYKGQVWREKSYLELCNHNVLNIVYSSGANLLTDRWPIEKNGKLYVPPVPGWGFINDQSQIPWDSEILQSFTQLTDITNITFHSINSNEENIDGITLQLLVGNFMCLNPEHYMQCVPSVKYYPWYLWTKEG